jgi:hypothetical protein
MALDLNHGVHFIRGGTEYFYGSYTHAVSPALAFSVGGVTRYVPFTSGGGYLKLQKNGTTYGVTSPSATVTVTCTFNGASRKWTGCSISIGSNGFASAGTITVEVTGALVNPTRTFSISANQTSASETTSKTFGGGNTTVTVTVSVFGRTYTGSASKTIGIGTATITVPVTVS